MRKIHVGQTKIQNPGAAIAKRHCCNLLVPCPETGTFGRAKIRVRGDPQRIRGRRDGGKVIERISVPAKTYPSWQLIGQITPTTHLKDVNHTLR